MVRWFVLVISIAWYGSMSSFTTEELNAGFMSTTLRNNYFHYFSGTNKLEKISPTAGGNVTAPFTTNNRSFNYDGNGNISTDYLRGNYLLYDRANLPYRVSNGNTTYAFGYNTADARIFKGNDNQAYYYLAESVYDMTADEWEHYPGGLAIHKNNSLNLIIKDHLTNTRAILGTNDAFTGITYQSLYDYYPYGKVLRKWEAPRSRFQSTDHETDSETGYNNRNARWYDDESFSFLQTDPLGVKYPSLSLYNYVARNPIVFTDPNGKEVRFESEEALAYHKKYYNKTLEDGTDNLDYKEEYAKLYDKAHGDKNLLFIVNEKGLLGETGFMQPRRDKDNNLVIENNKLVIDINYKGSSKVNGGSALHTYMEEIYHAGQSVDIKNRLIRDGKELNTNLIFGGTLSNEVEAKSWVAKQFNNYNIFWSSGNFEVPTTLGVMGGNFRDIDKRDYLKYGLYYPCTNIFDGSKMPVFIGGHYSHMK